MADYPFKINITTKDGTKKSFFTASLATNVDTIVSASAMVGRINNMFSASSFIESIEAPSLTSTKYNNTSEGIKFLSASVTHPNTGSVIFTDKETSDNGGLDHYEFYGTKVCSVLGLPEGVPIYTENFKLSDSSTDTTNYISGEFISDRIALKKGFKMSPQARVQSNLVWDHAFGEGFLQWVSGSNTKMSIGYNNVTDRYAVSAPSGSFNLVQSLKGFAGTTHVGNYMDVNSSSGTIKFHLNGVENVFLNSLFTSFNSTGATPNYLFQILNSSGIASFSVQPDNSSPLYVAGGATFSSNDTGEVPILHLDNTNNSADGALILFEKDAYSEADNDVLGNIRWRGHNDVNQTIDYARLYVRTTDISDGTEDGDFHIQLMDNGTLGDKLVIGPSSAAFTDNLDVGAGLDVTGNITVTGTVDGVDVATIGGYLNQAVKTTSSPTFADITISDLGTFAGGINVGATTDPGTDNMIVAGTSVFGKDTSTNDFTMQVYNGNNDGIVLIRDDSSTTDNEHLGGIGFDSLDGGTTTSTLQASAYIIATAAENHSSTNKGGDIRIGTKAKTVNHGSNATERMRITSEGDVGIGTSGDPGNNHRLEVKKSTTGGEAAIISFQNTSTNTTSGTPKEILELKHGSTTVNSGLRHITMRQSNGTFIGLVSGDPVTYGTFTGFHMSQNNLTDAQITGSWIPGMIVKSNGNIIGSGSYLSEAFPEVELTTTQKDKAVMGVYSHVEPPDKWRDMDNSKGAITYNALGEGRVLVTDTNGNIETGDYICSSIRDGHGEKQDDDILHNYTVAKATQHYNFASASNDSDLGYKSVLIACTYHCG